MDLIFRHQVGDADVRPQAGGGYVAMKGVGPGTGAMWAYEIVCSELPPGVAPIDDSNDARCGARIIRLNEPELGAWECAAGHASSGRPAASGEAGDG